MTETIGIAVKKAATKLATGNAPRIGDIEANALMLDCLGFSDRAEIMTRTDHRLDKATELKFEYYVNRRLDGEPVAYILGHREFYGRKFFTTPAALIPRPETEELVDVALAHVPTDKKIRALDMGTGCGVIGISIALLRQQANVTLVDVSKDTLELAQKNASSLQVSNVHIMIGDWYQPLAKTEKFSLIVSNPPYVNDDDPHLKHGDVNFEPPIALQGGADGLSAVRKVIKGAADFLSRGGVLIMEHGFGQKQAVATFFAKSGFCGIRSVRDLAGIERIVLGVKP